MPRTLVTPQAALIGLVTVSVVLRFVLSLSLKSPWIGPDETIYAMLGRSFWTTGQMHVLGAEPFYGFYPVVAGLPLAVLGPGTGLVLLKAFQAVVTSSTILITYAWTRQLAPTRWALAAAAMTASLPALAYSGLIMTESIRLPAMILALWMCSRMLAAPSRRNQALAAGAITLSVAIRLQSLVLFPAIVLALILFGGFERTVAHARRLLPLAGLSATGLILLELARRATQHGGSVAYGTLAVTRPHLGAVLSWSFRLAGDLFLLVVGVPVLALLALVVTRLRDREPDRNLSALLAVAIGYIAASLVGIGTFISIHSDRLQERYEIDVPVLLFVVAAVWLARGMPRPQPYTLIAGAVAFVPALLLPVRQLAVSDTLPDSFMLVPLVDLARWTSRDTMATAWLAAVCVLSALVILLPRRSASWLAGLVIVCLAGASVLAQRSIDAAAASSRVDFFGSSSPEWTAHAATGPIAYLDDGDPLFTDVMQQLYWNPRITALGLLPQSRKQQDQLPAGVPVSIRPSGFISGRDGSMLAERFVIAPRGLALVGRRVAQLVQGRDEPGLALWRTNGAPRISTRIQGLLPHGQLNQTVKTTVYGCEPGALAVTVSTTSASAKLTVSAGKLKSVQAVIVGGHRRRLWLHAPRSADGRGTCVFYLAPVGHLVVDGIAFRRGTGAVPEGVPRHLIGPGATEVAFDGTVTATQTASGSTYAIHAAYCLDGQFLELDYNQAMTDPAYKGALYANFIEGVGLTCSPPPPGYHRHGFATAAMDVPPGIYPYYSRP